jgi:hypothetical protein
MRRLEGPTARNADPVDPEIGTTHLCHSTVECGLLTGTRSAEGIMASGHASRINRPNTWLLRPGCDVKKVLANTEPSIHGTKRPFSVRHRTSATERWNRLPPLHHQCVLMTQSRHARTPRVRFLLVTCTRTRPSPFPLPRRGRAAGMRPPKTNPGVVSASQPRPETKVGASGCSRSPLSWGGGISGKATTLSW